ncbi:MAG: glycosyltransferase [Candidatus Hydrogenedentes bacterium]|nr:glycosyltransferase [Candidatus Hydrogenedentota bacterium]
MIHTKPYDFKHACGTSISRKTRGKFTSIKVFVLAECSKIQDCQESRLRNRLQDEGSFRDLLFFLLVKRDFEAIDALTPEVEGCSDGDLLFLDTIRAIRSGGDAEVLVDRLDDERDPWLHYTVAKILLNNGNAQSAIAVASRYLRLFQRDCLLLNLAAKFLAVKGEQEVALQLIESSLKLNPAQNDMAMLRDCILGQRAWPVPLYLDPLPLFQQVSFYVPVYNVERYIRQAIEGLISQNYPLAEIIVVDDGTPDRSIEIAMEYPVRIVRHEQNRGLAAARNTALKHASGSYVGSVDSDAVPDVNYTKYAMMEYENPCPELAGVGGRLIEAFTDTPADLWRKEWLSQDPGPVRKCPPLFLYGSNTVLRRESILGVGGYGEQFRTNNEDVQLCNRLRSHGFSLIHTPWPVAYHHRRDTLRSVLKTKWNWLYWNRVQEGTFDTCGSIVKQMAGTLLESVHMMLTDRQVGRRGLLYIDFLWMAMDAVLNTNHAVHIGQLDSVEARYIQNGVLESVRRIGAHYGSGLYEKVIADLSDLLLDGDALDGLPDAPWRAVLSGVLGDFERVCIDLDDVIFRVQD